MAGRLKKIFSGIFYYPFLSREETNTNQIVIRNKEWQSISAFIPKGSSFLDVGCGAGYAMTKARDELGCKVSGIDPEPGAHGVGRWGALDEQLDIRKANAEKIPFEEETFDVVYSSHVLEHVQDTSLSLSEMNRVLKDEGILIIGMPTAAMAFVSLISQLLFNTHIKLVRLICPSLISSSRISLREALLPVSHSHLGRSVFFDLRYYRISNWKRMISEHFNIQQVKLPLMYPYPEMRQIFKPFVSGRFSSSVFFICSKKKQ
jgi:2-polyprenyl-3-methyl-5-hydroxy-6-metoxy-1,4-benzoquinol methylase